VGLAQYVIIGPQPCSVIRDYRFKFLWKINPFLRENFDNAERYIDCGLRIFQNWQFRKYLATISGFKFFDSEKCLEC